MSNICSSISINEWHEYFKSLLFDVNATYNPYINNEHRIADDNAIPLHIPSTLREKELVYSYANTLPSL